MTKINKYFAYLKLERIKGYKLPQTPFFRKMLNIGSLYFFQIFSLFFSVFCLYSFSFLLFFVFLLFFFCFKSTGGPLFFMLVNPYYFFQVCTTRWRKRKLFQKLFQHRLCLKIDDTIETVTCQTSNIVPDLPVVKCLEYTSAFQKK